MSSKEIYCYRILKAYSIIVDFDGTPQRKNVPSTIAGETYGQWKKRVLGDTVENVVLYVPTRPANQTKISTLQDLADAEHLEKIFFVFGKEKENQKKSAINEATENAINKTEQLYAGLPKKDLEDILEELDDKLEPSVAEFLNRFVNATTPNIDTRDLILDLIKAYNETVIQYRKKTTTA